MELLPALEKLLVGEFLGDSALRQLEEGAISKSYLQPLVPLLHEISERYLEPASSDKSIQSEEEAAAYLLYYGLLTSYKLASLLPLAIPDGGARTLSALDFGGGPGIAAAVFALACDNNISYTNLESNEYMRRVSRRLLEVLPRRDATRITCSSLPARAEFDIILLNNVVNELSEGEVEDVFHEIVTRLTPHGRIVILETALKGPTRRLMKLRDQFIVEHGLHVFFPCTHDLPCPMLKSSLEDWCHAEIRWQRPGLIEQLDKMLDFNKHRLKSSVLVFGRSQATHKTSDYRIVRAPRKNRIGHTATVCGSNYYGETTLRKRDRNEENKIFTKLRSFDLLTTDLPLSSEVRRDMKLTTTPSVFTCQEPTT